MNTLRYLWHMWGLEILDFIKLLVYMLHIYIFIIVYNFSAVWTQLITDVTCLPGHNRYKYIQIHINIYIKQQISPLFYRDHPINYQTLTFSSLYFLWEESTIKELIFHVSQIFPLTLSANSLQCFLSMLSNAKTTNTLKKNHQKNPISGSHKCKGVGKKRRVVRGITQDIRS